MPFAKGISGNPDGRRSEAHVKRAARAEGAKSIAVLATVRDDEDASPEVRAQAAMRLLDIAQWNGRPIPTAHLNA